MDFWHKDPIKWHYWNNKFQYVQYFLKILPTTATAHIMHIFAQVMAELFSNFLFHNACCTYCKYKKSIKWLVKIHKESLFHVHFFRHAKHNHWRKFENNSIFFPSKPLFLHICLETTLFLLFNYCRTKSCLCFFEKQMQ